MAKKISIKFTPTSQQQNRSSLSPPDTPTELSLMGSPFDDFAITSEDDLGSVQLFSITDEESEDNSESIGDPDCQRQSQQLHQQQNRQPPKVEDEIDMIDAKIRQEKKKGSGNKMDKFMKHLQEALTPSSSSSLLNQDSSKNPIKHDIESETTTSSSSLLSSSTTNNQNSTSWLNDIKFTNLVNLNKLRNEKQQQTKIMQSESMDNFFDNQQQQQQSQPTTTGSTSRKMSMAIGVKNYNHPISTSSSSSLSTTATTTTMTTTAATTTMVADAPTTIMMMTNTFSSIVDANGQIMVSSPSNDNNSEDYQQQVPNESSDISSITMTAETTSNSNENMAKESKDKPQKLKDMFIGLKSNSGESSATKKKFTLFDKKTFQPKNKQQQQSQDTQQDLFNKLISPMRTTTPSPTVPVPSSSITSALLSPVQQHSITSPSFSNSQVLSNFLATFTNASSSSAKVSFTANTDSNNIAGCTRSASTEHVDTIGGYKNKSNKMTNSKSMMTFRKATKFEDNNNNNNNNNVNNVNNNINNINNTIINDDEEENNQFGLLPTYLLTSTLATQNPTLRRRTKSSPLRNRTPTPDETIHMGKPFDHQQFIQQKRQKHRLSDVSHSSSSSSSLPSLNDDLVNEKNFDTTLVNNENHYHSHHHHHQQPQQQKQQQQQKKNVINQSLWSKMTSSITFQYYLFLSMAVSSGFFICISPLPSFINGFIFGFLMTFFIVTIGIIYLVANFFLIKSDDPKRGDQSGRSEGLGLKRTKSKRLPFNVSSSIPNNDGIIYAGWVYEFIGDYIEREKNGFVSRLVYLVLSGSKLNIFVPSQEISDKKLKQILLDPTSGNNRNFALQSQKVIDFSRIHHKRICLYLTKNVRNQRKYIWSKKYPICIEFNEEIRQDDNLDNSFQSASPTPILSKLVIFARTCREKEEWFWAIKTSIDSIISSSKNSISVRGSNNSLNDSPSESKTYLFVASTGEFKQTDPEILVTQQNNHHHHHQQCLHILTRRLNYSNFMRTNILNAEGIGPGNPGMMTALTWFNVLLNRLSFDILNKPNWSAYIAKKLQRKLRRLRLPYFMESLTITEIDIGTTLPKFNSVPSVPTVDDAGLWIEFDVNYSGGFTMTLETKINLLKLSANVENFADVSPASTPNDSPKLTQKIGGKYWSGYRAKYRSSAIGTQSPAPGTELNDEFCDDDSDLDSIITSSEDEEPETAPAAPDDADTDEKQKKLIRFVEKIASNQYFQKASQMNFVKKALEGVSNMSIMLTVQINSLNGTLAINIPEPPTDRLWYGFRNDPSFSITARPKLGDHDLNLSYVTNFIEKKLRNEFFNYFVIPNMDDFFIPSLNTGIEQYINVVP
uniref:Uncharacterized protein LOC113797866 n=1 Tax=Dermatophagoides pteronyssinus TaxID=6956 RepID=A0A6P6YH15_DERPT|nr:uncharacterized protein LOC113797866 [Dermatophagoides pteronyssinus]